MAPVLLPWRAVGHGLRRFGKQDYLRRGLSTLDSKSAAAFAALEHENWQKAWASASKNGFIVFKYNRLDLVDIIYSSGFSVGRVQMKMVDI